MENYKYYLALNVLLSFVAGTLVYSLLPYAHGVRCDVLASNGIICGNLSQLERLLGLLVPIVVLLVVVAFFYVLKIRFPKFAIALLWVLPAVYSGFILYVGVL